MCHNLLAQSLSFYLSQLLLLSEGQKGIVPLSSHSFKVHTEYNSKCFEILDLTRADCDEKWDGKRAHQFQPLEK